MASRSTSRHRGRVQRKQNEEQKMLRSRSVTSSASTRSEDICNIEESVEEASTTDERSLTSLDAHMTDLRSKKNDDTQEGDAGADAADGSSDQPATNEDDDDASIEHR